MYVWHTHTRKTHSMPLCMHTNLHMHHTNTNTHLGTLSHSKTSHCIIVVSHFEDRKWEIDFAYPEARINSTKNTSAYCLDRSATLTDYKI